MLKFPKLNVGSTDKWLKSRTCVQNCDRPGSGLSVANKREGSSHLCCNLPCAIGSINL